MCFIVSLVESLFNQINMYQSQNESMMGNEDDILQTNGEVAFDCNVEELFIRADVLLELFDELGGV